MEWARYYLEANEGGDGVGFVIKTSHSPENLTYATLEYDHSVCCRQTSKIVIQNSSAKN